MPSRPDRSAVADRPRSPRAAPVFPDPAGSAAAGSVPSAKARPAPAHEAAGDELPPPLLELCEARRSWGRTTALDGLSFEVEPGEFVAVLGPNGAGKTTMIRAIAGRVRLDAGQIRFAGKRLRPGRTRPEIGVVPQDLAVYPDLSARENLTVFAKLHGVAGGEIAHRVSTVLEWIGLADRGDDLVGTFSGGMKRRINIACAVLHGPRLVLLDEPTVGVDPQSREKIFDMLTALREQGTAFLLTTHHLEEAEARCDRIVIVDHGRVIAAGRVPELIRATIGTGSHVTLRLDRPLDEPIPNVPTSPDPRTVSARLEDVATDLPRLLRHLQRYGYGVQDVHVRPPSLQSVFLHLTGRDLRE